MSGRRGGFALYRLNGEFRWDVFLETYRRSTRLVRAFSCVLLLSYVVRALRWRIMLRPLQPHPHLWGLISATCIGFTAITLFGRPGELVRPYLISVRERVPFSSQLAAWLLERIYDLMMILIIFGYALTRLPKSRADLGPALGWFVRTGGLLAAGIGFACVVILIAASRFTEDTRARLTDALAFLPPGLHRKAGDFASHSPAACRAPAGQPDHSTPFLEHRRVVHGGCRHSLPVPGFPVTSRMGWIEVMIFIGFSAFGSIVQIPGIGGGTGRRHPRADQVPGSRPGIRHRSRHSLLVRRICSDCSLRARP